jgi:Uncharacterized conserved protein
VLVYVLSELRARFIHLSMLDPFYAAVIGRLLMGVGFIVLFRHQASLGGVNILALYLQDSYGIRAGKLQMAVDLTIFLYPISWWMRKRCWPGDRRDCAQPRHLDESPA